MKNALAIIGSFLATYLVFVFVSADINPFNWGGYWRFAYVIISISLSANAISKMMES